MNRQKKQIFAFLAMLALSGGVQAQIFSVQDLEIVDNRVTGDGIGTGSDGAEGWGGGNSVDNYVSVGSGLLLLAGMGGAYALLRRRKDGVDD